MSSFTTHASLLSRLRRDDRDGEAWQQFVDRYGSRLYEWCLHRGLQHGDAEDVTQNVLIKIARSIGNFQYDRSLSFQGWLRRVTENAITDYHRDRRMRGSGQEIQEGLHLLEGQAARQDLMERLSDVFDLEMLEHAMDRVRVRVDQRRWLAWTKTAQDQMPGKEVAESLNMPVATVYAARYQVQKLIAEEIRLLQRESPSPAD